MKGLLGAVLVGARIPAGATRCVPHLEEADEQTNARLAMFDQFAGAGTTINFFGINPDDAGRVASALRWDQRSQISPA
jgi:hypothetical protein